MQVMQSRAWIVAGGPQMDRVMWTFWIADSFPWNELEEFVWAKQWDLKNGFRCVDMDFAESTWTWLLANDDKWTFLSLVIVQYDLALCQSKDV